VAYAENTSVPVERSRAELERTISRYGATAFGYMSEPGRAVVMFEAHGRKIMFTLPLPRPDEERFTHNTRGKRTASVAHEAWEQACRQRWRALNLAVKAKLEAVEAGISEFEDEFLAYIMLPSGETMGKVARPAIELAYETGVVPSLMPGEPQ
jgi:hypothetical protein